MKEHLRALVEAPGSDPVGARNRVREYLQVSILGSLQTAGAMLSLAFLGGTALRVLYRLPRFSEDLDFSLVRSEDYDWRRYLEATLRDLQRQGYAVEIARQRDTKAVHSAFVRFPELLVELGLARRGSKPLAIKLEVDTNPPAGAVLQTTTARALDRPLRLQHYDRAALLAGKLHAILQRPWPKGRDYYDLIWYLSDRAWPAPNLTLLNAALAQTGWPGPALETATWRPAVRERAQAASWDGLRADVLPLLERASDLALLTRDTLRKLLADQGEQA